MEPVLYKFKDFLKEHFSSDIRKLPLHVFFGCPHREDRIGNGGCIYCNDVSFSSIDSAVPDVLQQIEEGITSARNKGFQG